MALLTWSTWHYHRTVSSTVCVCGSLIANYPDLRQQQLSLVDSKFVHRPETLLYQSWCKAVIKEYGSMIDQTDQNDTTNHINNIGYLNSMKRCLWEILLLCNILKKTYNQANVLLQLYTAHLSSIIINKPFHDSCSTLTSHLHNRAPLMDGINYGCSMLTLSDGAVKLYWVGGSTLWLELHPNKQAH